MAGLLPKIAVTGPFADVNFGDYAMLVNNMYDLNAKNFLLFSYNQKFLNDIEMDYFQGFEVETAEVFLKEGLEDAFSKNQNLTPFDLLGYVLNINEITRYLSSIDVLLVNGGGYFNSLWSMPHRIERLVKIMVPVLVAERMGKKIVFSGNGYGPFGDSAEFFSCFFNSLKKVVFQCRDELYSPVWMRQLGVESEKLNFIPDDLLLINDNLSDLPLSFEIKNRNYVVLETYLPTDFIEENIDVFIKFSNKMSVNFGLGVVFLPFHLGRGGVEQGLVLNRYLDNFEFLDISSKGYLPIQDAINIIDNAALVLSNRYHAVVLALKCATPTVSVLKDVIGDKRYYYNKNRGVVDQVLQGAPIMENFYFSLDYLDALDYVVDNFEEIVSHQEKNFELVHSENIQRLLSIRSDFVENF